jgi:3-hydroxyisobutyrate dehydrogenase-like beta-hydroxyacid dehydrogenase
MTAAEQTSIGIFGLGAMGSAMAGHLLDSGVHVLGSDPDAGRQEAAVEMGVQLATPDVIASRCDVILTSLPSYSVALEVLGSSSPLGRSLRSGTIIIETSTLSPDEKESLRKQVAQAHGVLLDCPMSGTAHQAREGDLVAYLSGDDDAAKSRSLPILMSFCRSVRDLGEFGTGTKTKLVANHLVAAHNVAAAEALSLAQAAGLDLPSTLAAIADGAGSSRMLHVRGPLMIEEDYVPAGMRVDLFLKDLTLISEFAARLGVPSPIFDVTVDVYREAERQGRGSEDTACAFSVLMSRRNERPQEVDGA